MKKEEKKEREVDTIKLFTTFLPPPKKNAEQANETNNPRRFLPDE